MADTSPLIATGVIQIDRDTKLPVYVYADGVKIFVGRDRPGKFFEQIAAGASGTGKGHLVFTSLHFAPRGASFPAVLNFTPNELTLTAEQPVETFGQLPNAQFKQLKVTFTEPKGKPLSVQGGVSMTLMGEPVPLMAALDETGLIFKLASSGEPKDVPLPSIGKAHLDTVVVQTEPKRWEELQILYNFGKAEGGSVQDGMELGYDHSGSSPGLDLHFRNATKVEGGGLALHRNSEASTREIITRLLDAVVAKNEFTVELWVKPTATNNQGAILSMGDRLPGKIFFQLAQERDGTVSISSSFTSAPFNGPALVADKPNHIVFTHNAGGTERLYLDGKAQSAKTGRGAISKFPTPVVLVLGNTPKKDNAWQGEIYHLAIYSRALTEDEIQHPFRPTITTSGAFTIANAPAPLDKPLPAVFNLLKDAPTVDVKATEQLTVRPELHFSNLELHWEQTGLAAWKLSGGVDAQLWKNNVPLIAKLIGTKEMPRLEFTETQTPVSIHLEDWGHLEFTQLTLNVTGGRRGAVSKSWALAAPGAQPFAILPGIRFRDFDLFADFLLEGYGLSLTPDHLILNGSWLGEKLGFHGVRPGETATGEGRVQVEGPVLPGGLTLKTAAPVEFVMPFDFTMPPLFDPKTGARISDGAVINQEPMAIGLDLELGRYGLLTHVSSTFSWQSRTLARQEMVVPTFTLYTPPPNKNGLLGHIVKEIQSKADELFAGRGSHLFDFFIGERQAQPAVLPGRADAARENIPVFLPKLFAADGKIASTPSIFTLEQSGDQTGLTIDLSNQDQANIDKAYKDLWVKVAAKNPGPGAVALLRRSIAEQLPLPYDRVLQYYYGWTGNYLDLLPGMRLRVDFQNYQFVQASDQSARRGFSGSGSTYFYLNSYHSNGSGALLGFDAFLTHIQSETDANLSKEGGGGLLDLLRSGGRKAYYRLFYPTKLGQGVGPERVAAIVGADQLGALLAATDEMNSTGSVSTANVISFYFRGRAAIVPEIQVFVGEEAIYVPVGTTWRQLLERHAGIPAALEGQDLSNYVGNSRPLRLLHEEVNSNPVYVFIKPPEVYKIFRTNQDFFDLPVVMGDRFPF